MSENVQRRTRRRLLSYLYSLVAIAVLTVTLPFTGLLMTGDGQAIAQQDQTPLQGSFESDTNPRSNFWRAVREGNTGYSAVRGPESNVLIQNGGENYRMLRNGPVLTYGAAIMGIMLAAIILFHLFKGRVPLEGGRSGRTVPRWSKLDRTLHWTTAISFIVLLITGLSLAYGRDVLIPVLGKDAFAAYAELAKVVHNYVGPVFGIALVLFLLKLLPFNFPNRTDVEWFKRGGGLIGNGHPSAGRMNAGEKVWFWLLMTFGLALVISGVLLNFPQFFGIGRSDAQIAVLVHAATSLILIAVAFGHIYIGTSGTEGSLEGMTTGRVDEAWARQHHDLWLEDLKAKGVRPEADSARPAPVGTGGRPQAAT